ncbi:jg4932 [Pararge aegeria aegeria]|uniref:Jg4932 protein n=1 Tax=Pararge aegeria aegeria TaxID=348720 RepID=A0A8S4SIF1_9NEOP|nr:jg4932 [Pararge aegeria aegeria]
MFPNVCTLEICVACLKLVVKGSRTFDDLSTVNVLSAAYNVATCQLIPQDGGELVGDVLSPCLFLPLSSIVPMLCSGLKGVVAGVVTCSLTRAQGGMAGRVPCMPFEGCSDLPSGAQADWSVYYYNEKEECERSNLVSPKKRQSVNH